MIYSLHVVTVLISTNIMNIAKNIITSINFHYIGWKCILANNMNAYHMK